MLKLVLAVLLVSHCTNADRLLVTILKKLQSDLTLECRQQFRDFWSNFTIAEDSWALQMVDSSSKIPSGLLNSDFGEMGDFDQCVQIRVRTNNSGVILGKYCLGEVLFGRSKNTRRNSSGSVMRTSVMVMNPIWGLCLPNGCSTNDANMIGNAVLRAVLPRLRVNFSESLCQTIYDVEPRLTAGAVVTIILLTVLVWIVLLCTFYDIYNTFLGDNSCPIIIKGFSMYTNSKKIFRITTPTSDQIPCLNGLKFFSAMWVVLGHQFSIPLYGSITNTKFVVEWTDKLYSMFIVSATLSVDTFLTVGGALMMYGFMKAKSQRIPFNIFFYYLHRYLRLTAPFALVVLFSATLLQYTGSGPKWPYLIHSFQNNCQDYWWSALLYVQNYVNVSKMCVGQTWYLNIDMQLYLLSPILFFGLWKLPKLTQPVLAMFSLMFIILSFYNSYDYDSSAIISNLHSDNKDTFDNKYYLLTHTRATPWIFGILLGHYLFKIQQKEVSFNLSRRMVAVLWTVCFVILLTCVLCGHSTLRDREYNQLGNAFHIAVLRPFWSVAIAWIIVACFNNCGGPVNWILSLPIFQVLNTFTYSIYLTHVTLLYAMVYDRKWPDYFSGFNMMYQFWGTLSFSSGLAIILVFVSESPVIVMEKILLGAVCKRNVVQKESPETGIPIMLRGTVLANTLAAGAPTSCIRTVPSTTSIRAGPSTSIW